MNIIQQEMQIVIEKMVSIPFKREGTCEHPRPPDDQGWVLEQVSIPFKREGTCEHVRYGNIKQNPKAKFQFPSNGKARVNLSKGKGLLLATNDVSIPFKREGTCEQDTTLVTTLSALSFNSLQTGRHV